MNFSEMKNTRSNYDTAQALLRTTGHSVPSGGKFLSEDLIFLYATRGVSTLKHHAVPRRTDSVASIHSRENLTRLLCKPNWHLFQVDNGPEHWLGKNYSATCSFNYTADNSHFSFEYSPTDFVASSALQFGRILHRFLPIFRITRNHFSLFFVFDSINATRRTLLGCVISQN